MDCISTKEKVTSSTTIDKATPNLNLNINNNSMPKNLSNINTNLSQNTV